MFSLARKCVTPNCLKTPGKWHRRCHWEGVIGNGIEWSFEAVENIRTVQSLNKQLFFHRKYASLLSAPHRFPPPFFGIFHCSFSANMHQVHIYGFVFAFSQSLIFFMYALAFWVGSLFVLNGIMRPASVFR